jgi:beclin 1
LLNSAFVRLDTKRWGQTVLLLHTMASKLKYRFSRYRLVPNGSSSRLEKIDDSKTSLQLSAFGGFKLFGDSKFDVAMVAFLDCLQQFKSHVEAQDQHFKLPYRINKDKIGDSHGEHSIKFQGNHEETWTKALKFMLTDLKWCLAWVCKQAR